MKTILQYLAKGADWIIECAYLLWAGWWPAWTVAGVRWTVVERNTTYHYTRRNAWLRAKDRTRYTIELRRQLMEARSLLGEAKAFLSPENIEFEMLAQAGDLHNRIEAYLIRKRS